MQQINKRKFPYPVLGIGDDVNGTFNVNLNISSDAEFIQIQPKFNLENEKLSELIDTGLAEFVCHVYCTGTMYRNAFKTRNRLSEQFKIPANRLNRKVEIDFFICAAENIAQYQNSGFHPDYSQTKFSIEKGNILAYGGKGNFIANKSPNQLKSVSSLMIINKGKQKDGPFKLIYSNQRIIILLSEKDYEKYQLISRSPHFESVLHCSLVLPVLTEALNLIESEEGDQFKNHQWYQIIQKLKDENTGGDSLEVAQKLLDNPTNRTFANLEFFITNS